MPRVLLLCFIHGFKVGAPPTPNPPGPTSGENDVEDNTNNSKGSENTFHDFPSDLKRDVAKQLPDHRVETVVYPKYETKGELAQATEAFRDWLKERVMDVRKEHLEKPWPPTDREVGVVLVAHSMGGFVAADTLFLALNDRAESGSEDTPLFPLIQGILTFDTAYNGLARSMFVYGAFSNYGKVSNVFNVMTAIGSAAPATLSQFTNRQATSSMASASTSSMPRANSPAWKTWQLVAVRTGTVGAIAAGGVAAYMHREAIMRGMQNMRNINRESVMEGYRQSMESLGQGLAYVNRGSVGHSFAWLSDHFTFVGALMKQKELSRRLQRMGSVKGVGIRDFYTSLGENGKWSGGYFVPERTFCAIPEEDHPAHSIFQRHVMRDAEDEVQAHMSMFMPEKNKRYMQMTEEAASLVKGWFLNEDDVVDDPELREMPSDEKEEDETVERVISNSQENLAEAGNDENQTEEKAAADLDAENGDSLPDESPIDIAAAASLVPLPEDGEGNLTADTASDETPTTNQKKRTYRQYLFQIAQQTGHGAKAWWPSTESMPSMSMPSVSMPQMPSMPSAVSSLGQVQMPSYTMFGKKQEQADATAGGGDASAAEGSAEATATANADATKGEESSEPQQDQQKSESNETSKPDVATEGPTVAAADGAEGQSTKPNV